MFRPNFFQNLLLSVIFTAVVIVLAGHSTLHAKSGVEQCLMCASYSDPGSANVPHAYIIPVEIAHVSIADALSGQALLTGYALAFLARAPPNTI